LTVPPENRTVPVAVTLEPALRLLVEPLKVSVPPAGTENAPVLVPPPSTSKVPLETVSRPALLNATPPRVVVVPVCFVTVPALLNATPAPCQCWKSASVWIANV
jgi:hypothetical protein